MSSAVKKSLAICAPGLMVLACATTSLTQSRWTKAAPFPEPDEELYGVTVSGKIYVIGGFGGGKARGAVYEYDPTRDAWTKKRPMALAAHHEVLPEYVIDLTP